MFALRKLVLSLGAFSVASFTFAQALSVSGTVYSGDDNLPIIGAVVSLVGSSTGATTDSDGKYSLNATSQDSLKFSFIGYIPQTIAVGTQTVINVTLQPKFTDEIVIVGYGVQRKSDLTGSVSSLKGKDITKVPSMSPEQALQGRLAGVQVNSVSGAPGAVPVVRIRGVGTLNNSAPIYVVDGVILDDISFLSSSDIASMEVLKDASATAIYGSRGANGVVLVSTKRGSIGNGKPVVSFSTEYSMQRLPRTIDLLNANQFTNVLFQLSPATLPDNLYSTDWQDEIFEEWSPMYSVNTSVTGATDKHQYYFGISYFSQDGIIRKSDYQRVSLKINDSYKLNDNITLGANYTISPDSKTNEANVVGMAYRAWPISRPYNDDGSFAEVFGAGNPLAAIEYNNSTTKRFRGVGNLYADIKFLKNFTFRSSFGQDYSTVNDKSFTPAFFVSSNQSNALNDLSIARTQYFTWLWENTVSYEYTKGKHRVDALAGYTAQKYMTERVSASTQDLLGDDPALWYIEAGNPEYLNATSSGEITTLLSQLGRVNYAFDNRYLATVSIRRDGSSKFGENNRYGVFPSVALGWNIHNESFFPDTKVINRLKLRGSWGIIGNEKIPWSRQYSLISNNQNAVFDEQLVQGATFGVSGNPDLRWEETTQVDVGLEVGLWNDKLQVDLDYYNKTTDGILVDLITPGHLGNGPFTTVTYNAASVRNSGFELQLTYNDAIGKVNYQVNANASTIKNEVLQLGPNSDADAFIASGSLGNGQLVSRTVVGNAVGAFYGYETDGVIQTTAELNSIATLSGQGVGDLKYVDQNGDGVINDQDRVYLGSYIPKMVYGFGLELNYKNWDMSMDFMGQFGNKIYNGKMAVRPDFYNFEAQVLDAWEGAGTSDTEPRPSFGGVNYEVSDYFVQDGGFFRLRTLSIGYDLKSALPEKWKFRNVRVYARATNLFTLTKYNGYTPEIASNDATSSGIDLGVYPLTSIYSLGLNFNF
jgi:TonB-linked SusC/RagA family outer membrane protein